MSNFEIINKSINPHQLLEILGYDVSHRMKCPIHGGSGKNFALHGDSWTCHSHHCGEGDARDTVNLYTFIHFNQAYKNLSSENKKNTLDFFKSYVKLNNIDQPTNKLLRYMKESELILIVEYFKKLKSIKYLSDTSNRSKLFQNFIIFYSMVEKEGVKEINYHKQFIEYCKKEWFFCELKNYIKDKK